MENKFISIGNSLFKIELITRIELEGNLIKVIHDKGVTNEVKFESDKTATEEMNKVKRILGK